jgi:hypothetical protein
MLVTRTRLLEAFLVELIGKLAARSNSDAMKERGLAPRGTPAVG